MPVRWPSCRKAAARFAASEDLPTPPLPLATAITRVERSSLIPFVRSVTDPRRREVRAERSSGVMTPNSSDTRSTPATGDGERDSDGDSAAVDTHVAHHVELDHVALQLRVDDLLECLEDLLAGGLHLASEG